MGLFGGRMEGLHYNCSHFLFIDKNVKTTLRIPLASLLSHPAMCLPILLSEQRVLKGCRDAGVRTHSYGKRSSTEALNCVAVYGPASSSSEEIVLFHCTSHT